MLIIVAGHHNNTIMYQNNLACSPSYIYLVKQLKLSVLYTYAHTIISLSTCIKLFHTMVATSFHMCVLCIVFTRARTISQEVGIFSL